MFHENLFTLRLWELKLPSVVTFYCFIYLDRRAHYCCLIHTTVNVHDDGETAKGLPSYT